LSVLKTQYSKIKSVGSALEELTKSLGINKKLQEYDAVVHWEEIVGEQIAKMTTAMRIVKGVLFVQVKTSTWRNELTLRKKEIINKINLETGTNAVKDIKFQ
jgi:predicted nucleic acid-binding Zn ribbon protein